MKITTRHAALVLGLCAGLLFSHAAAADDAIIAKGQATVPDIRVEVEKLTRDPVSTVTLRFAIVNDSTADVGSQLLDLQNGTHLVDAVNRKIYGVIHSTQLLTSLSSPFEGVKAKSRVELWARFPAPPNGVDKLTILLDNFYPIDNVPVGQ